MIDLSVLVMSVVNTMESELLKILASGTSAVSIVALLFYMWQKASRSADLANERYLAHLEYENEVLRLELSDEDEKPTRPIRPMKAKTPTKV